MTQEQIEIVDALEEWAKKGFIVDIFWSFTGYRNKVWELQNDHDSSTDITPSSWDGWAGFPTKWDACKMALKHLNDNCFSLLTSHLEETKCITK